MGGIWTTRGELLGTTGEIVGRKAGLALTRKEMIEAAQPSDREILKGAMAQVLRIRSEDYEDLIRGVLYGVGAIRTPQRLLPALELFGRYRGRPQERMLSPVIKAFSDTVKRKVQQLQAGTGDRDGLVDEMVTLVLERHGPELLPLTLEFLELLADYQHSSPYTHFRRVEWKDEIALRDLFKSAALDPTHGRFLDQRYIDFLGQNFERIDDIHWRKFEALTCEFFEREGYRVVIGPGSNDEGVDARVWRHDADGGDPPLILVQCKREKAKIGRTVVKALWADVVHEGAESGLLVTTSSLAPGADATRVSRGYNVEAAERDNLKNWVERLRTPGTGVFLSS